MVRPVQKLTAMKIPVLVFLAIAGSAGAQTGLQQELRRKFEAELHRVDAAFDGVAGAQFIDLASGEKIGFNTEARMPTASVIKVPVLIELYRQAESKPGILTERRAVTAKTKAGGSGLLRLFGDGTSMVAIEDLATFMINISDNTAANMVIDEVGMENVNKLIASLGFKQMRLARHMMDSAAQARGDDNVASPAEGAEIMARIAGCNLPVNKESCSKIRRILEIPQAEHPSKDPIPRQVPIAFKWGSNEGVSTVWAIVNQPGRPYVMSIMTTYAGDAAPTVRALSAAAWAYYSRLARANPYGARVLR
jgi:beta-lactamase class A